MDEVGEGGISKGAGIAMEKVGGPFPSLESLPKYICAII
jgi:hypothetical protein